MNGKRKFFPFLQNGFLPPQSVAQDSVYQSSQAYGREIHGFIHSGVVRHAQQKSWLNPSWRIRRASTSSLPFRRVPMTWSSQVWLRNTPKTKACTRCLSADGSAVREHSRSTRVSAKERPACQLLRQFSAVWRGEGGLFFTGELYMRNVQVSTCKTPGGKGGCRASSGFHLSFLGLPTSFL